MKKIVSITAVLAFLSFLCFIYRQYVLAKTFCYKFNSFSKINSISLSKIDIQVGLKLLNNTAIKYIVNYYSFDVLIGNSSVSQWNANPHITAEPKKYFDTPLNIQFNPQTILSDLMNFSATFIVNPNQATITIKGLVNISVYFLTLNVPVDISFTIQEMIDMSHNPASKICPQ